MKVASDSDNKTLHNSQSKLRVLIVDDEAPARRKLHSYLENDERFIVVGEAKNGREALTYISKLQPEILLLDIQMPGMTVVDVLRLMDAGSPAIIFTTAFDEYAVQAFEVSAIDYLLKPISQQRFQLALDKVITLFQLNWDEKIAQVLQKLQYKEYTKRIAVRQHKLVTLLNTEDISHIVSEHRLINVYTHDDERDWTIENLSQLAARLDPECFVRIHRSSIINLSAKFEIEPWDSGRLKLHLNNGKELMVSREHANNLRQRLGF
jgi:DNA-binding LytR/AlgR family response regulator